MGLLSETIDLDNEDHAIFLSSMQGNILKSHGRDNTALVLITVSDAKMARNWIETESKCNVTTAKQQLYDASMHTLGKDGGPFETISISATGYAALEISRTFRPSDIRFRYGMKAVRNSRPGIPFKDIPLNDPPFLEWDEEFQEAIDLMIILADENTSRLLTNIARIRTECSPFAKRVHVENGQQLRRDGEVIEHFGFADGISQPLFIKQDIAKEEERRGAAKWDPSASLGVVLAPDFDTSSTYGSYLLFRKLEQNINRFNRLLQRLASELDLANDSEVAAGLLIGRMRDGTPLIDAPTYDGTKYGNDFQFDQDVFGMVCPFHSHIRKMNPRGDIHRANATDAPNEDLIAFERQHRIARRGVPYGDRPDLRGEASEPPGSGCGLLFLAYAHEVFSFEMWLQSAEDEYFIRNGVGVDPIIAQNTRPFAQEWPCRDSPEKVIRTLFTGCVRLRGGEYFFTPSVEYLRSLHEFH